MKARTHIIILTAMILLISAYVSYGQDSPNYPRDPKHGSDYPSNPNIPGTSVPGQDLPAQEIPERDKPTNDREPRRPNYRQPIGDTFPGDNTPEVDDVPSPAEDQVPPEPVEPAVGADVPETGSDISDLPTLPDDPSLIQPELETEYLKAPVFKEKAPLFNADDGADYIPDEVIVILRGTDNKESEIQGLAGKYELEQQDSSVLNSLNVTMAVLRIPDGRAVPVVVNALSSESAVLLSQPNYAYEAMSGDNPQYGVVKIGADVAHKTTTGKGVTVAVIDTGVDYTHPSLKDRVVLKSDFVNGDMSGFTADSHGTSVTGIIAASSVEAGDMTGVAPDVRIIAARACWTDTTKGGKTVCSTDKLAKALDYAVSNNAGIINFSLGGPKDGLISALIENAYSKGVTIVAAGGNGGAKGKPVYPAALPQVIAVSATDSEDGLYGMSTRGNYIDVAAPGVDILSPAPGGSWQIESGTSMAAAHVTGAIALLLQNYPELSPFQIKYLLGSSSVDLGNTGKDPEYGEGRIDVLKALGKLDLTGESALAP